MNKIQFTFPFSTSSISSYISAISALSLAFILLEGVRIEHRVYRRLRIVQFVRHQGLLRIQGAAGQGWQPAKLESCQICVRHFTAQMSFYQVDLRINIIL